MKECSSCKIRKPFEEFNFKNIKKGLRAYQCKECSRSYVRSHYEKNREYYLLKSQKRNHRIRDEIRTYVWNFLMTNHCTDCGEKDPVVLEFDHMKEKLFSISHAGRNKKLVDVQREIEKCEVRCANCHRRKTAKQFEWHKKFMPL